MSILAAMLLLATAFRSPAPALTLDVPACLETQLAHASAVDVQKTVATWRHDVWRRAVGQRILATARQYLGVPYVFGGTSPSGFDCSGFVMVAFAQHRITLPRCADDQFYAGKPVGKPDAGDLVFFSTYLPGPSHVGIYIGCGEFIHASSHGIAVSNLKEDYFACRYLGARSYF